MLKLVMHNAGKRAKIEVKTISKIIDNQNLNCF